MESEYIRRYRRVDHVRSDQKVCFCSSQTCVDLPPTSSTDANTALGSKVSLQRLTEPTEHSYSQNTLHSANCIHIQNTRH